MECSIQACKCDHEYQDQKYGSKKGVMNPLHKSPSSPQRVRCTVCGTIYTIVNKDTDNVKGKGK